MPDAGQLDYPAIAIVGATASGKSTLAITLAERFRGEVVSCDALQVYRGMDIGTAKPSPEQQKRIPHHMLDLRPPQVDFSAGDYIRLGRGVLRSIRERERIPIVAGGTGFYLRALIDGLFQGPGRSEELRSRLGSIVARRGPVFIHRALRRVDPEAAARITAADTERNIRAYEVFLLTGRPMSWWQSRPRDRLVGFRWLKIGIEWPRPELYARIDHRVEEMIRNGLVAEVETLMSAHSRSGPAFKAIGYRQIADYLEGKWSLEQAVSDIQRESRRYAKRQITWFRTDQEIVWLAAVEGEDAVLSRACTLVDSFLA